VSARIEGKTNISFQQASAEALPFDTGSFSLVVSRHAPHHFNDAGKFLSEVRRALSNDGRFVLADQICPVAESSEWLDRWERIRDPSHFLQRTVAQWQGWPKTRGSPGSIIKSFRQLSQNAKARLVSRTVSPAFL
jgi:ubiquinone/menaquinone biosynthesis C-methylase UbiE